MFVLRRAFASKSFKRLRLTLLSTDHCPLCRHFKEQLEDYLNTHAEVSGSIILEEKNINSDAQLFEEYRYDVPVLLKEDEIVLMHRFNRVSLERALKLREDC
ncbi:Glutaredoxin-like protein C5orf63 [Toxocara canis]|uniref:Glutaredoxin-like protein n=1 Tax=Toxocara canis TaxID=6265 RepID=A0A0B2V3M4_TOXCA|nr:Glutaredoxin-like protein C5orf63 [Toxocara canis]